MAGPYRDGGSSLEERLEALEEVVAEREATFSVHFWELAAKPLGLDPPGPPARRAKLERKVSLADRVAARQDRLEKLERAMGQLGELERSWRTPPETTPPPTPRLGGLSIAIVGPLEWDSQRHDFVRIARARLPEGRIEGLGPYAVGVSAVHDGAPIEAMFDAAVVTSRGGSGQSWELQVTAQTSISPLAGELYVRPQRIGDEFLGIFGLRKEHTLGDHDFDGMFFVRGDDAAAAELLTEEVRAALPVIGEEAVPHLVVNRALARIHWSYEPRARAFDAAVEVLAALRAAEPTRSLRAT